LNEKKIRLATGIEEARNEVLIKEVKKSYNHLVDVAHNNAEQSISPIASGYEECEIEKTEWIGLRLCLTCGHVGCCDSSKNKHTTTHFHSTEHPIIQSFEPDEHWKWCYMDETFL
jgi:uncharacterized UBP type Zn finger protein